MNNKMFFTIALSFLVAISSKMTQQLNADLRNGTVSLQNQVLEIKKEISGNTAELLDSNTLRVDGICSFDSNGKLETGRAFVFDEVSIGYATDAASGKEGALEYSVQAPAVLQNALVIITQNGREVLRLPFRDFHNIQEGFKVADEYTELKGLAYFVDGEQIEIKIKLATGQSLPAGAKHYVYFRASGLQTAKQA